MSFLIHLINKMSKNSPLWPPKVKKTRLKSHKKLPSEEAFTTHHIFFLQKVVDSKSFHYFIYLKVVVLYNLRNILTQTKKMQIFEKKMLKSKIIWPFFKTLNWPFGIILGPKGVELQVELQEPKKSKYRKYPKQLDSNGRPA